MKLLVVGAGVIGTVYGAQLAAAGHDVSILARGERAREISDAGLVVRDAADGTELTSLVDVVTKPSEAGYDVVLVTVRSDQLVSACEVVGKLSGSSTVLLFGNNPSGRSAFPSTPSTLSGAVRLGFPGIGGSLVDGVVEYLRISQQPTALEACDDPLINQIDQALNNRHFKTQRVQDMEGWLQYHAVFVASVAAALYRCGADAALLAADRSTRSLMCHSVSEGFAALRRSGVGGAPGGLAFLHRAVLVPFAVSYWGRTLRSPMGELCFAAHARHAQGEMQALSTAMLALLGGQARTEHLRQLLGSPIAAQAAT